MTTKKARQRRLVRSGDNIEGLCNSSRRGDLSAYIRPVSFQTGRGKHQQIGASLYDGYRLAESIRVRTCLALHDALIARGWPSPWREV